MRHLEAIAVEKPWGRTDIPLDFGDFDGRRIGEIWFTCPDNPNAPIMIKFLFTSERLSIQVHPGDDAARAAGYPRGKGECWLVFDAGPDAELGVRPRVETTAETLRTAALDGSIIDRIDWRTARPDDFVYNRAGTLHAIGAGLIVVEVQQMLGLNTSHVSGPSPQSRRISFAVRRAIAQDPPVVALLR